MTRDRADNHRNISFRWPIVFWIGMVAVSVTLIVLLREVLLPFVTGMVLAYLLNPLAQRIERRGLVRLVATLLILAVVVIAVTGLLMLFGSSHCPGTRIFYRKLSAVYQAVAYSRY